MLRYDQNKHSLVSESGIPLTREAPRLNYGVATVIDILLVGASSASSWSAAVDHDLKASSTPMCRTTSGITATASTEGVRLSIPLDTKTTTYKAATEGKTDGCVAYFGIYGYDGDGDVSFYAQFPVVCCFTVDAEASGTVEPVSVTYLTQAQVEAIADSAADEAIATYVEEIESCVAQAESARDAAIAAKNLAVTAKNDAVTAKNQAVSAKNDAVTAKNDAVNAKELAIDAKDDAVTASESASGYATTAEGYKNLAETAKNDAVTAKTQTISAKDDAVTAKNDAVTAKTDAISAKTDCLEIKSQTQAIHDSVIEVCQFEVGHAYNVGVTESNNVVSVTWTDPLDNYTSSGACVAKWGKTRLVVKIGGFPENENDGTVLVDNTVRNTYRTTPFTYDMGVASNYCFALFTMTTGGIWNTSESAPRFTINLVSFATIRQLLRSNMPLSTIGLSRGSVVNIQTSDRFTNLRWKLVDTNYRGNDIYDNTVTTKRTIWIPQYLPCETGLTTAIQSMFDAPEILYAVTDDANFVVGKAYYKLANTTYTQLVSGTDYNDGESISAWTALHGLDVYSKNHSSRVSNGNNNWKDSNRRQNLNATGTGYFVKQNIYDKNATSSDYTTGFKGSFYSDFLELIMPCYNLTARNTVSQTAGGYGGGTDITLDTFWLPSMKEIFNTSIGGYDEGLQFEYFAQDATTSASRIMRDEAGNARNVWLRSANPTNVYSVYCFTSSGGSGSSTANSTFAFLPAMCIA